MKNDVPSAFPGPLGLVTKRQTFGVLDAIGRSQELNATQHERLDRSYQSTSEFILDSPELGGDVLEIFAQGSRALGTTVRPMGRTGFDIDSVSRMTQASQFKYAGPGGATRLLDTYQRVLQRYGERHNLKVSRKARCIQIEYADDLHADITPFFDAPLLAIRHGEHHGVVADRDLKFFSPSNPRGYKLWFDERARIKPMLAGTLLETKKMAFDSADIVPLPDPDEVFPRFLCRLVQVAKTHRNQMFKQEPDLAPTSIFITTLIAHAYRAVVGQLHEDELSLYLQVIHTMRDQYSSQTNWDGSVEWVLLNPTTKAENIASRMNTLERQKAFRRWHARFLEDISLLALSIDRAEGADRRFLFLRERFGDDVAGHLQQATMRQVATRRAQNTAVLLVPGAGPMSLPSRTHTFHGGG